MRWGGRGKLVGRQAGEEITELAASRSPAPEQPWVLAVLQTQGTGVRDAGAGDLAGSEGEGLREPRENPSCWHSRGEARGLHGRMR